MNRFSKMIRICLFALALGAAGISGRITAEAAEPRHMPAQVLVKFTAELSEGRIAEIRNLYDAVLAETVPAIGVELWRLSDEAAVDQAVERLNAMPEIEYAEPNYLYAPQSLPDDADFEKLWHLQNTGQPVNAVSGTPGADISAVGAWAVETGSRDIVIAVIDSGVALEHPDISGNIWVNPGEVPGNGMDDDRNRYVDDLHGWDFVNDDNNPSDYSQDLYGDGHGTHVAGIIAAEGNNGIGGTGVMWRGQIMPLQVFDLFENSPFNGALIQSVNILHAVSYAVQNGARIINCSFGGPGFSQAQFQVFQLARQRGCLVVAAAGNGGSDNDVQPVYPAGYDLDNIISVAATDETDRLAPYSNFGIDAVDLAAPGGSAENSNIYSLVPPERKELFFDDFESGLDRWVTEGVHGQWFAAYDPLFDSTVAQDSQGEYQENEAAYIRTAEPIRAENIRGALLSFDIDYQLEPSGYDVFKVEVSADDSDYSLLYRATGASPGIQRINLLSNDAPPGNFYLRFGLYTDDSVNFDGVYLDNVRMTGVEWMFDGDEYGFKSGTSMAAPVVAGVAGLVWSHEPDLDYLAVRHRLLNSVDRIDDLSGKVATGGRINAEKALSPESVSADDNAGGCFVGLVASGI